MEISNLVRKMLYGIIVIVYHKKNIGKPNKLIVFVIFKTKVPKHGKSNLSCFEVLFQITTYT